MVAPQDSLQRIATAAMEIKRSSVEAAYQAKIDCWYSAGNSIVWKT